MRPAILTLLLAAATPTAAADVLIRAVETRGGRSRLSQMWLARDRYRAEDETGSFIFRGDRRRLWIVHRQRGLYAEYTAEMLADRGGEDSPPQPSRYQRSHRYRRVNDWSCETVYKYRGSEKTSELCVVPLEELGLRPEDFEVLDDFLEFFGQRGAGGRHFLDLDGLQQALGYAGLPVEDVQFNSRGERSSVWQITEVEASRFPDSTFELPPGIQQIPPPR